MGQIAPAAAALGEPIARQAESALSRLERTLAARELSLEDLLRLRLFVGDLDDLPAIERAIDSSGPTEWPAVSIVELPAGSDGPCAPGQSRRWARHQL